MGIQFDQCRQLFFSVHFEKCLLDLSSFYKMPLKNTVFDDCSLKEVNFTQASLNSVKFNRCNLYRAVFDHTDLEKADFSTSFNYSIDPAINKVNQAKFSLQGLPGLLDKYDLDIE